MITAKDVQKKKFEKVKFGYSPEEVDSFLAQIENDLRLMQQDLDDSNEKVQLLADKVREYKDTEDDLKNALLLAQKQARQVVEEAQRRGKGFGRFRQVAGAGRFRNPAEEYHRAARSGKRFPRGDSASGRRFQARPVRYVQRASGADLQTAGIHR